MNYFELHIGDLTEAIAHLSILEDGAYNRLLRKYYATERPLPAEVRQVQRLIGARSKEEREAVESVLREFFDLQDDGWHQSRCDAEIAAFHGKQAGREGAKEGAKERQRRARERRKKLFDDLRGHGIVPPYTTTTVDLEAILSRVTGGGQSRDVTPPVTRDVTATQTPDTKHQSPEREREEREQPVGADPPTERALSSVQGFEPTRAGLVCRAMRQAGMPAVNPGDPRLLALLEQGATEAEFAGLAAEAVPKGKGFAWVLTVLQARREDAAAINLPPSAEQPAPDPMAWTKTSSGVIARAGNLGIDPWDGDPREWPRYVRRVIEADAQQHREQAA